MKKLLCLLLLATLPLRAAEGSAEKNLPVRGFCIPAPSGNRVEEFLRFINQELAPRSVNVLILRVDYNYQFTRRPEMADAAGLSRQQAEQIAAVCKEHKIRIVPLVNLLGHQSWHYGRKLPNDQKNPGHTEAKCFLRMFEEIAKTP